MLEQCGDGGGVIVDAVTEIFRPITIAAPQPVDDDRAPGCQAWCANTVRIRGRGCAAQACQIDTGRFRAGQIEVSEIGLPLSQKECVRMTPFVRIFPCRSERIPDRFTPLSHRTARSGCKCARVL